jgi:hypothetical protein
MRAFAGLLLVAAALPARVAAQGDCFPSRNSNEANTFAILSVAMAFSAADAPSAQPRQGVRAGFLVSSLPRVDDRTATPTTCRPGKGPENTALLFAVPQPRVVVSLPSHLEAEAGWIPPVRVNGVKANLVGLGLSWTAPIASGLLALRTRAHATLGVIHAPITCDDADLKDATSECFGGTRSDDAFHPNIFGADMTLGWSPIQARFRPYVGAGYNRLQPRFRVNFTNQFGETDRRRVEVNLDRFVAFGGATWLISPSLDLSGELYAAPSDAITARMGLRATL